MEPRLDSVVPPTGSPANARAASISGFLGSTLEYYDFFIYGSAAALIFGKVFFPDRGAAGTLLSIGTLGVAYVARPIGAVLWGHLGDRVGRRATLLMTLLLMGAATFLIGCLPAYGRIGVAAPVLLVLPRMLQGLSAGGESPGSSSLTLEHAPDRHRAFFTSFTLSGIMFGTVLSSLVFVPISALPEAQLLAWGWRIPFWLSLLVTGVAYFLRRRLAEPSTFTRLRDDGELVRLPVAELARTRPLTVLRIAVCATFTMTNNIVNVFALAFGIRAGLGAATMLLVIAASNATAMLTQPLFGLLADRVGRKPVFVLGVLGIAPMMFVFLGAIDGRNVPLVWLSAVVLLGLCYAAPNGVYGAYFPEQFPAPIRYSGMAIGLMVGLLAAGLTPAAAQALTFGEPGHWTPVAWMCTGFVVAAAVAALTGPETYRTPTAALGARSPGKTRATPAAL
jgi:MFS family permease